MRRFEGIYTNKIEINAPNNIVIINIPRGKAAQISRALHWDKNIIKSNLI